MKLVRFPALALALVTALAGSLSAMPFRLQADTTEITGVLIYSRTGPADNFDVVTAPGSRSEATTRLHFQPPLNTALVRLVEKMMIYAVEPEPAGTTTYPDVARVKVTGHVETSDEGKRFMIDDVEVAQEPGDGSDAVKMKRFIEDYTEMQKGMVTGSGDPKAVAALKYLEDEGYMESIIKLGAQVAKDIFQ